MPDPTAPSTIPAKNQPEPAARRLSAPRPVDTGTYPPDGYVAVDADCPGRGSRRHLCDWCRQPYRCGHPNTRYCPRGCRRAARRETWRRSQARRRARSEP